MDRRYIIEYTFAATRTVLAGLTVRGPDNPLDIAREEWAKRTSILKDDLYHPWMTDIYTDNQGPDQAPTMQVISELGSHEAWPAPDDSITTPLKHERAMEVAELLAKADQMDRDARQYRAEALALAKMTIRQAE